MRVAIFLILFLTLGGTVVRADEESFEEGEERKTLEHDTFSAAAAASLVVLGGTVLLSEDFREAFAKEPAISMLLAGAGVVGVSETIAGSVSCVNWLVNAWIRRAWKRREVPTDTKLPSSSTKPTKDKLLE